MQATPPRAVDGNVLVSTALPPIRVRVDPGLAYTGRLQFILYDVDRVDLYLFVRTDGPRAVQALLAQFEGYLDHVDATYAYPETETVTLGAHTYVADAAVTDVPSFLEEHPGAEL